MVRSATRRARPARRPGTRTEEPYEAGDDRRDALDEEPEAAEQAEMDVAVREVLREEAEEVAEDERAEEEPGEEAVLEEARTGGDEEEPFVEEGAEPGVVVEVLLRRTGVLPGEAEIEVPEVEERLPMPRRPDEFVCSTCFLIKPRTQLGDAARRICRECLDPPGQGTR